jgi:hypothetical protein
MHCKGSGVGLFGRIGYVSASFRFDIKNAPPFIPEKQPVIGAALPLFPGGISFIYTLPIRNFTP